MTQRTLHRLEHIIKYVVIIPEDISKNVTDPSQKSCIYIIRLDTHHVVKVHPLVYKFLSVCSTTFSSKYTTSGHATMKRKRRKQAKTTTLNTKIEARSQLASNCFHTHASTAAGMSRDESKTHSKRTTMTNRHVILPCD